MSELTNFPRYGAHQARMELERAEAIVNAFCETYERLAALFSRALAVAKDDAQTVHHPLLRAST